MIPHLYQKSQNIKVNSETISAYLGYLTDSFLFSRALRYDVKGKKYFEYPCKYYCTDIGLCNVRLELRQQEEPHVMENIIYNELKVRGYQVDVGVISLTEKNDQGQRTSRSCEIDFIARKGAKKYYLQSAFSVSDPAKKNTELRPLRQTEDSFKKILISQDYGKSWFDETGILRIGLIDFLLDENSLDR